jgi:hypothetical protein
MNPSTSIHTASRRRLTTAITVAAVFGLGVGVAACGDDAPDDPRATVPADGDEAMAFDDELIVGLPVDEAEQVAEDEGFVFRIAVLDGEDQALTMDFVPNRVNVAVDDGIVTGVEFVG